MSSTHIKIGLYLASCLTLVLAVCVSLCVSYFFFFDIFFYGKSSFFGYGKEAWISVQEPHTSNLIQNRKRDVSALFSSDLSLLERDVQKAGLRVVVIGDSMAYGLGVMEHQSFPRRLEKKLKRLDATARVWNLSIAGDHILDYYAKYEQAREHLHPDIIIIGIVDNDLFIDQIGKYKNEDLKNEIDGHCAPGSESKNTDLASDPNLPPHEYFTRVLFPTFLPSTCNLHYLEEVLTRMEKDREKILFLTYSHVNEVAVDEQVAKSIQEKQWKSSDEEYTAKENFMMSVYLAQIRAHGFEIVQPEGGYEHVSERESHPSAQAHERFATLLFDKVNIKKSSANVIE